MLEVVKEEIEKVSEILTTAMTKYSLSLKVATLSIDIKLVVKTGQKQNKK